MSLHQRFKGRRPGLQLEPQNFGVIVTTEGPSASILLSDVVKDLDRGPDDSSHALLRVGGAELRKEQ